MSRYFVVAMIVIGLFGVKSAYAIHPQIDSKISDITSTLCSDEEDIYFSAKLKNGKFASLCGYKHKSPDTGYVKYRYGLPNNIELEYPKDEGTPKGRFLTYHIRLSPNVQGRTIFFYIDKYRYDISHVAGNCSVFAYEGKKVVFESFCDKQLWLNTFEGLSSGVIIRDKEFVKRFPQQFQDPTEPEFH